MPLSLLTQLQKSKEDELESRAKNIKTMREKGNEPQQMTVNNSKRRFKDKSFK